MDSMEYVTVSEVRRVCRVLGIRDWTKLKKPTVTLREAKIIQKELDGGGMKIDPEQFRIGLEVELEHGTMFGAYNVTNNHPLLTGKIVLAHFMETLDYYRRLEVAELEGDMLKALVAKDGQKANKYYKRIVRARASLAQAEDRQL